jgi:hypothetical protein
MGTASTMLGTQHVPTKFKCKVSMYPDGYKSLWLSDGGPHREAYADLGSSIL